MNLLKVASASLLSGALLVTGSPIAYSQSNTRYFQMALWGDPSADTSGKTPHGDIATFDFGHQSQPPKGPTVLIGYNQWYELSVANVGGVTVDWSRVVAVEVDEPYTVPQNAPPYIDNLIRYANGSFACQPAGLSDAIQPIDTLLAQRQAQLKALAPKARFWVNFTDNEAGWMAQCGTQAFNRAYIDVISADWSADGGGNNIASATPFLSAVAANRAKPDQQLALIPGVFSAPTNQLPNLQGFFDYANNTNQTQTCNLPLGSRGVTGFFDGCPVWMVLGWLATDVTVGKTTYLGMLNPNSISIEAKWDGEVSVPLTPSLAHARPPGKRVVPALDLLLN
jgi:hypothetical protein